MTDGYGFRPRWADVEYVRSVFEPWDEQRLVLDAGAPLDANLAQAVGFVRRGRPGR